MTNAMAVIYCLLTLHSADGVPLHVVMGTGGMVVKPIAAQQHDHVTGNVHSVIYIGVKSGGFGVVETDPEIMRMLDRCGIHSLSN